MSKSKLFHTGQDLGQHHYHRSILIILLVLFSAALCIVSPFTLPIGKAPITLSVFVLTTAGYLFGPLWGLVPVLLYILLGALGLPVFSGSVGGISILFGPTGGYIFGWLFLVLLTGLFARRFRNPFLQLIGVLVGQLLFYVAGVLWYMAVSKAIFLIALLFGVLSYLASNLIQGVAGFLIALFLYRVLRNRDKERITI